MTLDQVIVMMNWVVVGIHQMAATVGGVILMMNVLGKMLRVRQGEEGKAAHGEARVQAQEHITAERQPRTDQRQGGAGRGRAGQGRPEQGRARQGRTAQGGAGQGKAKARMGVWFKARHGKAWHSRGKKGRLVQIKARQVTWMTLMGRVVGQSPCWVRG